MALPADSKHPGRVRAPCPYLEIRQRRGVPSRCGAGRIVFLPYIREVFAATQEWAQDRDLFPAMPPSPVSYDEAALA